MKKNSPSKGLSRRYIFSFTLKSQFWTQTDKRNSWNYSILYMCFLFLILHFHILRNIDFSKNSKSSCTFQTFHLYSPIQPYPLFRLSKHVSVHIIHSNENNSNCTYPEFRLHQQQLKANTMFTDTVVSLSVDLYVLFGTLDPSAKVSLIKCTKHRFWTKSANPKHILPIDGFTFLEEQTVFVQYFLYL